MNLDLAVFQAVQSLTGIGFLDQLMIFAAEFLVFLVPLALVYLWFQGREGKKDSVLAFSSAMVGIFFSYLMGLVYFHQNPSATLDTIVAAKPENAFPSQHTVVLFSIVWPLFWRDRRNIAFLALLAALGTGFSRVYIGEHWPIDIIGSLIASAVGFGVLYLSEDYIDPFVEEAIDLAETVEGKIFNLF